MDRIYNILHLYIPHNTNCKYVKIKLINLKYTVPVSNSAKVRNFSVQLSHLV